MSQEMLIRAWKDPVYRAGLTEAERELLAPNPAGLVELNDEELMEVSGGTTPLCLITLIIATVITVVAGTCSGKGPTEPK